MRLDGLLGPGYTLHGREFGDGQRFGPFTMVPIVGGAGVEIESGMKALAAARPLRFGGLELTNELSAPVLVPPHLGRLPERSRSIRVLCAGLLLGPGETRAVDDCLTLSAGAMAAGDWAMLPIPLRRSAVQLRGLQGRYKLGPDLERFNRLLGLPAAQSLRELWLDRSGKVSQVSRCLEPVAGQTGALFLWGDRPVGLEIAPDEAWFRFHWPLIVRDGYGPLAMLEPPAIRPVPPLRAESAAALRTELFGERRAERERLSALMESIPVGAFDQKAEEKQGELVLHTLFGGCAAGQVATLAQAGPKPPGIRGLFRRWRRSSPGERAPEHSPEPILFASVIAGPDAAPELYR